MDRQPDSTQESRTASAVAPISHTPGPWFMSPVQQSDDGWYFATVGPFDVSEKVDPNHYEDTICEVSGINHPCAANARLIASAPDLLSALKELLLVAWLGNGNTAEIRAAIDSANAAIAKAEAR